MIVTVAIVLAFCAIGSAVVVRLCDWPHRFWWPVFGYVAACSLIGGLVNG